MEKILLVLNARKADISLIGFASEIAYFTNAKLIGLFIENPYVEFIPTDIDGPSYFETISKTTNATVTTDTDQTVRVFKEQCQKKGIDPEVYIDQGEPMQDVIFESRFADLLIVDPNISFYDREEPLPSHFVKEILVKAECPVLLAPEKFNGFDEIVFCYDGSASSVFALKQFTYLFSQFGNKKAMLLEVNNTGKEEFNDGHKRMMDWLRVHYHSVYYHGLKGDVKDALFQYFFMEEKKLIVMGAYGRSLLSNFFKKSNADVLIRMIDLPIFITHY